MFIRYILYVLAIITNALLSLFLVPYSVLNNRDKFPKWAFYFDNDEYGYTGDLTGFMSNYRGFDIKSKSKPYQVWSAYQHSVFRNPCFNIRHCRWVAIDMLTLDVDSIYFKGNTYHHGFKWSHSGDYGQKYYKFSFSAGGKRFQSYFRLIPLFGNRYLYLRWGMKTYPRYWLDNNWVGRLEPSNTNSRYSLPVLIVRLRSR